MGNSETTAARTIKDVIDVVEKCGESGADPETLIALLSGESEMANVIEVLQRAIEGGKISLNSEGMVIAL